MKSDICYLINKGDYLIRYGVLGVGHLGRFHAIQANQIDACKLSTVYDQNQDRAIEVATELGVKSSSTLDDFFQNIN